MTSFSADSSLSLNLPLNYQLQELYLSLHYVAQICCFSTCEQFAAFIDYSQDFIVGSSCSPWNLQYTPIDPHLECFQLVHSAHLQCPPLRAIKQHYPDIAFDKSNSQAKIEISFGEHVLEFHAHCGHFQSGNDSQIFTNSHVPRYLQYIG